MVGLELKLGLDKSGLIWALPLGLGLAHILSRLR